MPLRPLLVAALLAAACSTTGPADTTGATVTAATPTATTQVGVSADGGNTAAGTLDLGGAPTVVDLADEPRWVAGRLDGDVVTWEVLVADGGRQAVDVHADGTASAGTTFGGTDGVVLDAGGELLVERAPLPPDLGITLLADTQVVDVGLGRVAVLVDPTTAYGHGVLGDAVEAGAVAVVDVAAGQVVARLEPEAGRVVEQRGVLATELDGRPAVVVTTSAHEDGARVEVWTLDGSRRVVGPAIGMGGRWRHTVAVTTTPDGRLEVAEVVTPHLGKVVSRLQVDGDELVQVAAVPDAVASHAIGSRNLDQAALVDVDGDGQRDVVGPAADRDGIAWVVAGADHAEQADAGHRVVTNLALLELPGGHVAMAYGTEAGQLVVRR